MTCYFGLDQMRGNFHENKKKSTIKDVSWTECDDCGQMAVGNQSKVCQFCKENKGDISSTKTT